MVAEVRLMIPERYTAECYAAECYAAECYAAKRAVFASPDMRLFVFIKD